MVEEPDVVLDDALVTLESPVNEIYFESYLAQLHPHGDTSSIRLA